MAGEGVCEALNRACEEQQLPLPKLCPNRNVANCGTACVTKTLGSRKVIPGMRTYLAVDGGMSDNHSPGAYQSVYRLWLLTGCQLSINRNSHHCW